MARVGPQPVITQPVMAQPVMGTPMAPPVMGQSAGVSMPMAQPVMGQPMQPMMMQPGMTLEQQQQQMMMQQQMMPQQQAMMMQPQQPGMIVQAREFEQAMIVQQPGAAWGDQARHVIQQQRMYGPPGAPPGGTFRQVKFCGPNTFMVGCVLVICGLPPAVCCCPCDQTTVYVAPDGTFWTQQGVRTERPCLAQGI